MCDNVHFVTQVDDDFCHVHRVIEHRTYDYTESASIFREILEATTYFN